MLAHPPMHRDYRDSPHLWKWPEIHESVRAETGVIVECGVGRPTAVGEGTWLMTGCQIGHDATVGERCEIAAKCVVGAYSTVGDGVKLGIGTIVRPRTTIGDGARTGCGTVVVKDIPAGEVWVGNPARKLSGGDVENEAKDEWEEMAVAIGISREQWREAEEVLSRVRSEAEGMAMWEEWWLSTRA